MATPKASPSVFAVPKSKASLNQNRFVFTMPGSQKQHSVPLLKFISPDIALAFDTMTETAAFKLIIDTYLPELFKQFEDMGQFSEFLDEWKKQSGIDAGESEDSAD